MMTTKNGNLIKVLLLMGICASFYTGYAIASDDVAPLVVDNGNGTTPVPEPDTWLLLLGGAIAAGIARFLNRKDK
jgi:hypothetical protein